ncbi:MAG: DUF11 domain-containing protein [Flavobacterium sp.]|nr:MAG: DUF11 domain-containing protein [Flavobacterium sp.]
MELNCKKLLFLILASLLLSCSNDDDNNVDPKETADLSIAMAASTNTPVANTNITFTLIAANKGPLDAEDVVVTNKILSGYNFVSAETAIGEYDPETGLWTIGDLENGATALLKITLSVNETGDYNNKASIAGEQTDIVLTNNEVTNTIKLKGLTDDLLYTYKISEGPNPTVTITGLSNLWVDLTLSSKFDLNIPAAIEGHPVTVIGERAFEDQNEIRTVHLPDGITDINYEAFSSCYTMTSINLPSSVKTIGLQAFYSCNALSDINFPEGLESIDSYAFSYCQNISTIVLPNSVTTINSSAFYGCIALKNITLPNNLTTIESELLSGCYNLETIAIPNTVQSIKIGAFQGCSNLTSVTIPASVTSIESGIFLNCTSLTSIDVEASNSSFSTVNGVLYDKNVKSLLAFPSGKLGSFSVPDGVTTISAAVFAYSKLTDIELPNSVSTIESNAFRYCTSLASITIPASVTNIGSYAFGDDTSLKTVIMNPTSPPTINLNLLLFVNCKNLTAIKVPAGSLSAYKATNGWSAYNNLIVEQ